MFWKLVLVASLAAGVFGRSMYDEYQSFDPYDQYSQVVATEYCTATKAEENIPEVKIAIKEFAKCFTGLVDPRTMDSDFRQIEQTGEYDKTIKKYCLVVPEFKNCISKMVKGLAPCLPPGGSDSAEKSTFALIDFACENDGARIYSFIKEDGPQCFQRQQFELAVCQQQMQSNVTRLRNLSGPGAVGALMLSNEESCKITDLGLSCIADSMKTCANPKPGQLMQELHDLYMTTMSCNEDHTDVGATDNPARISHYQTNSPPRSGKGKGLDQLMRKKLELEVRTAELEMWNRENQLHVQHTDLTSDILKED